MQYQFPFVASLIIMLAWPETGAGPSELKHERLKGAQLFREGERLSVRPGIEPSTRGQTSAVHIPRFCASIRSIQWDTGAGDLTLVPERDHWVISWKQVPAEAREFVITFDSAAILPEELGPGVEVGDGSITLHASQGMTHGEKLRFEPQSHKNTVGYWTMRDDFATWKFVTSAPAAYSVAVLQGCGAGQGGSRAQLQVARGEQIAATLDFTTVDTGHFQNFRWLHLGHVELNEPGTFQLTIRPLEIAKGALFDVRQIQLVKQAKKP
jgi:hypothetical protein